jgi:long-chain acyl-CoA synthetase
MVGWRATIFHGVPTMFTMMLEYVEQNCLSFDLSGVRQLICAGAPLPEDVAQRFAQTFHRTLQNYYAATECSPIIGHPDAHRAVLPPGSIGRLAPGAHVRIVSADGHDCPVGVDGEFYVRGAATLKRYLKNPGLTADALSEGWFRTGDLGRVDEAGYYFITGRIKDTIFRGGANIAPAEVEAVLSGHPDVASVAVVGAPDKIYGEVPVAYIVPRGGSRPEAQTLMTHAASALADFKVPRHYVLVDELPLGKTGKIDKAALKAAWTRQQGGALSIATKV